VRLLTFVFLFGVVSMAHAQTAEQKFKNIQIFKTLPATQLDPTMAFISGSLGVRCSYCHVTNSFDKDDKPTKLTARRMIQMVFLFDVRTGLLVRRYTESDTPLGKLPLQVDYEDYRDVDGIKQPFLIHWSFPGRVWGRKIDEIKQNVPLDDAKFNPIVTRP